MPKKELRRIEASVLDRAERMLEVLALYPRPPLAPFESPSGLPEGGSLGDIEEVAEALREVWALGLDPISDLTATLEDRGILVFTCHTDAKRRFDGLACHVGEWPIIVVGEEWPGDRQRFTLAHELGHLVLSGLIPEDLDVEKACNRFAGAFLAPASAVRGALGSRRSRIEVRELYDLKLEFELSMAALLYRARDLDIVDAAFYEKTMRTFSKRGWRRREPGEPIPPESPRFFEQLVYHALAESFIGEAKAAEILGSSLTEFQKHRCLEAVHAAPGE